MKETQFKGRLQDEINRLTDEMRGRTEEVLVHKLQMTMLNRTANRLEQALKSEKATVDRLTQQQEVLSQRYLKIQDELSIETQLYEEASSKINLLANQLKSSSFVLFTYFVVLCDQPLLFVTSISLAFVSQC
ncbi:uncharacterized protein LOC120349047 isoform X2 [Nilaparvata lugens]|uniref:uncharacterized protein LOC120349047 isoform X2 n=1 Tax=Nilaparvata lugens TaxID=108931 RepID=UPI00193E7A26|nr:uncharacterized protein LOC120349047 isoform X2 [Nilaparvata lugens]